MLLVSHGRSIEEIARELELLRVEVVDALEQARRKLGARHRVHAVATALRKGVIE